jgi:hypothetical protein
MLLHGILHHI